MCAVIFVVGVLMGIFGIWLIRRMSWVGDLISLGFPLVAIGCVVICIGCVVRREPWMVVALFAGLGLAVAAAVVMPRLPDATAHPVRPLVLVAANMLHDNLRTADGVADVLGQHPDVLVVSELNQEADGLFSAAFPYRYVTVPQLKYANYAEGVYSKFPLDLLDPPSGLDDQFLRVMVHAPAPFILYAVHLPRPTIGRISGPHSVSFAQFHDDVFAIDRLARAESGPVVVAGDLNLSDRTSGYRALLEGRHDAVRTRWAGTTYVGGILWESLALRIDQIFIPGSWCAQNGGNFHVGGSDHNGVRSEIGACR
ncbi:MAG: hypothetical protein JWL72_1538 [Ilumatobacteraceae bacterium]|nr:hypothetical protein [Ilumatobacteraceae bacterium]